MPRPLHRPTVRRAAAAVLLSLLTLGTALPALAQGLRVVDGQFYRGSEVYRGFGVNYYDAFLRTLRDGNDTSYDAGFADLAGRDIPFARFNAGGFWPDDFGLYQNDREEYFRRLDGVVNSAERHGVGLVPSLVWNHFTFADLAGEAAGAWGDPASATRALMRQYTTDVVTRYKDSPAILMWEFANELNNVQDLPTQNPNASISVARGTPAQRTAADKLSSDAIRDAAVEFTQVVRQLDPDRAISTGHSITRPAAFELRQTGRFIQDTPAEFRTMVWDDNPRGTDLDAIDTLSIHAYWHGMLNVPIDNQTAAPSRFGRSDVTYAEVLDEVLRVSRETGKPLFIGEFGVADAFDFDVPGDGDPDNTDAERLRFLLDLYLEREVPLAALWVYDRLTPPADDLGWTVTPTNGRAYQLDLLTEYNRRLVPEPATGLLIALPLALARRRW